MPFGVVAGLAGSAIGASIGGTILGVSAATIGGAIGTAVGSAVLGSNASGTAANQISSADQAALAGSTSLEQQNTSAITANEQPFIQAGTQAESQLSSEMGPGGSLSTPFTLADLTVDPGYQFDLQQGNQAVSRAAASQGTLNSGGTLKAIDNYTTGLASNEVQNAFNRYTTTQQNQFSNLYNMVNQGMSGTNAVNAADTNEANVLSGATQNDVIGAGAAQAAGTIGANNAITGGLQQLGTSLGGSSGSAGQSNLFGGLADQSAFALNNAGFGNTAYDMLDGA